MFIRVLFGDDDEFIANPDSAKISFVDFIYKVLSNHGISVPDKEKFDLVDVLGNPRKIHKTPAFSNIGDKFKDRETYIPVVFSMGSDEVPRYTLLLNSSNEYYEKIMTNLTTASKKSKRSPVPVDLQPNERSRMNVSRGNVASGKKTHRTTSKKQDRDKS